MTDLFIIASNKPWNSKLPEKLSTLTGKRFELISLPEKLTAEYLFERKPRYIFFPHWSHIIPIDIYDHFECVIFHMTDLPFGRGGSPLQNLIAQGIYETQMTAFKCVKEVDAGPIYFKKPLSLLGTAEEIYLRASDVVEKMIVEMIKTKPEPKKQIGDPVFFKRREPSQGNLQNANSIEQVFDMIRMLDAEGYPNAYINVGNLHLEFTRASRKTDKLIADVKITFNNSDMKE